VSTTAKPASAGTKERECVVCAVEDFPEGTKRILPIGAFGIGVYNVKGSFYAIANRCPHEGGPLCEGRQGGRTVVDDDAPGGATLVRHGEWVYCPWHQWGIELATGTTAVKPEWSVRTYPVKVVGGRVVVVW
jgi:nitrite reductase/ring-hydroxylating ferredoxin subunit